LSLLHGSARAQAADPTVAEDQAPANGTYDDATAETEGASRRINAPSHDAGFGFHTVRFRTEDGDVYSLHAPAITFDYWVGRRWGLMLHGAAYFPARAAQPGSVDDFRGSLRNEYDQRWGLDGSVMIGLHHELAEKLHLYTGIGVHLQVFRLNDAQFAPVEAVTFGVGGPSAPALRLSPARARGWVDLGRHRPDRPDQAREPRRHLVPSHLRRLPRDALLMDRVMTAHTSATHRSPTLRAVLRRVTIVAGLLSLVACDKSGVHDLARANDTLVTCGAETSTWLRSLETTTELFVLGTEEAGMGASAGCYVRAVVNQDSSVEMETGSSQRRRHGRGRHPGLRHVSLPLPAGPRPTAARGRPSHRPGRRPLEQSLVLGRDGEQLTLALGGDGRNLTSLPEVIRRLEPDTQAGAEDIFRLVNIMFYMSQTRVQGFGATGMTMYVEPKDFVGIVSGEYTVAVTGGLRIGSDLTYRALRDLTDIQMDGNQHTMVDLGGNGPTSEMLTFTLDHPDTDPIIYTIFYDDLLVVNGAAGDGFYTVDSNGDTFVVDWMLAQDVHVRNVLPVGE
jgi:hypothetical protein